MTLPEQTIRWIVDAVGSERIEIAAEPLPETSHANHRLLVDGRDHLLLRRFADPELADDPWFQAQDEVAALEALGTSGAPVPRLIAADPTAERTDVPALLITWLPGAPPVPHINLDVLELVRHLPAIHVCRPVARRYETYVVSDGLAYEELRPPGWTTDASMWERAFQLATGPAPAFVPAFIHRDYHEGNTLFEGSRLSGIVDWTTGCTGPTGIDFAHMRMNLTWSVGTELGDAYASAWRELFGDDGSIDPYGQLLDAIDWILGSDEPRPENTPDRLARFEAYVGRVLAELGA